MFPNNERQTYEFTIYPLDYTVEVYNGNHIVWISAGGPLVETADTDLDFWTGAVYAYKMTDDTTLNVYTNDDYVTMGVACLHLQQIPEFSELETIVGYKPGMGGTCDHYDEWLPRADTWLREQGLRCHPLAEGAD